MAFRMCRQDAAWQGRFQTALSVSAVLIGSGGAVKLADAGLAAFLHRDYIAAESAVGPFAWTVRQNDALTLSTLCCVCFSCSSQVARSKSQ